MDSKYAEQTMKSMSAPGSYFGFEKFDSASAAQDAFQISKEWSNCKLRGEFDTLQVIDEMYSNTSKTKFLNFFHFFVFKITILSIHLFHSIASFCYAIIRLKVNSNFSNNISICATSII